MSAAYAQTSMRRSLDRLLATEWDQLETSLCWTTGSAPATTVARRAICGLLLHPHRPDRGNVRGRSALVGPAESEMRPALGRLEIRGGRYWTEPRDGQPPRDAVVGLPVDDLLEGRQPSGHALGRGPDAAAPAGRRLLDGDRALPTRSEGGRRQVRPDHRRVGSEGRLDVEGEVGVGDVEPADGAFVLPASLEVQRERVDPAEVLDVFCTRPEVQGIGVETKSVNGGGREQCEAVGSGLGGRLRPSTIDARR